MLEIATWTAVVAVIGRLLLPGAKPGLLWAVVCAAVGFLLCFALARSALGAAEAQIFAPECAVPAAVITTSLLWMVRRLVHRRGTIFF